MRDWRQAQAPLRARLYQLRMLHGMTQTEVAAQVGIHPLAYGRAERGQRRIRRPEIATLAILYGIPILKLLSSTPVEHSHVNTKEYA